jgi:hypothetical protein
MKAGGFQLEACNRRQLVQRDAITAEYQDRLQSGDWFDHHSSETLNKRRGTSPGSRLAQHGGHRWSGRGTRGTVRQCRPSKYSASRTPRKSNSRRKNTTGRRLTRAIVDSQSTK